MKPIAAWKNDIRLLSDLYTKDNKVKLLLMQTSTGDILATAISCAFMPLVDYALANGFSEKLSKEILSSLVTIHGLKAIIEVDLGAVFNETNSIEDKSLGTIFVKRAENLRLELAEQRPLIDNNLYSFFKQSLKKVSANIKNGFGLNSGSKL